MIAGVRVKELLVASGLGAIAGFATGVLGSRRGHRPGSWESGVQYAIILALVAPVFYFLSFHFQRWVRHRKRQIDNDVGP